MLVLAFLAACTPCPEGLTRNADDICAGADDGKLATGEGGDGVIEWSELYDSWPACEALAPASAIDLDGGCVSGACIGDTYADLDATWGPGDCEDDECEWTTGISAGFDGNPQDGALVDLFVLHEPYAGADEDGLGVGAQIRCFAEILGPATSMYFTSEDGIYFPWAISWSTPDLSIFDNDALGGSGDWRVDALYIEGGG